MAASDKERKNQELPLEEEPVGEAPVPEEVLPEEETPQEPSQLEQLQEEKKELEDRYLRLMAEFGNFRNRTAKEKESLWTDAKADTIQSFLPVYDNLERALKQDTADEAYKKGVEMIMSQLKEVFAKLGVTEIEAEGKPFDPNLHNAVMHIEDENLGENTVAQVFQAGFMLGEKVIRFAMVQVAN